MSRKAVKDQVIAELNTFLAAQVPPIPFYDTINASNDPTDPIWVTAEFFTDFTDYMCISNRQKRIEYGTVDILVFGLAGNGYTAVSRLADSIEDHFLSGKLTNETSIIGTSGASEFTNGSADNYYALALSLNYEHFI